MTRTAGHSLVRSRIDGSLGSSRWECSCGADFGEQPVHAARKQWNEHKAALTSTEPEAAA